MPEHHSNSPANLFDIEFEALRETLDIECKAAQGMSGDGEVPKDFWETYSAMANTDGGSIFLGVVEKNGAYFPRGIKKPDKVIKELVDTVNSPDKVNINLLKNEDIIRHEAGEIIFLEIRVRRATRKERPVYLKKTPIGNSFRRRHEADQRMTDNEVKRMLADQQFDSLDHRILKSFGLEDLDSTSLRSFRQSVSTRSPESNFDTFSDIEFLKQVGAWRKDRETGDEGLTVAGLLMLGRYQSIRDEFPDYFVDYQEQTKPGEEPRYLDRVCPDGAWSGNLYDFYRKVYPKLVSDLKAEFQMKDGVRVGESPAHVALREAFVNALVHADYSVPTAVLIIKRPDLFSFKNPGIMRVPLAVAMAGGESDSRNKSIQDMFRMIGAGERQGHGIRKIMEGWKKSDWRLPNFEEQDEPSPRVVVTLSMLSLFPKFAVSLLSSIYEDRWDKLDQEEKIALILALTEGAVTHARLSQFCTNHPRDLSAKLLGLEKSGALETTGQYRAKTYHLPGHILPTSGEVFEGTTKAGSSSANLTPNTANLAPNTTNLEPNTTNLDEKGRIVHAKFNYPFIDDMATLRPDFLKELEKIAELPRTKKKVSREEMTRVILELCHQQYVTSGALSSLLNREITTLRGQYLAPLKAEGKLTLAFPRTPTDPKQAYRAT
ncbi:MAG: RNA-binding domain-containing protein [Akkermansiaceae bacterium]|jgi:ATP-dependent DNA helicase RecG